MAKKFFLHTAALTGSKLAVSASQIVILPIIATYLSVEDFGAVALAMTVVIFAQLMSDAGVGRSLIRQKEFVQAEWNTVYWFLVLVGFALMGVMLLIAPIVAKLFGVPIAESLISALSIVPFCFAIAAVPAARMERDGEFPQLALIELSAAVLGLIMAVWFAVKGAGAWALIAQHITIATVRLALVTVTSAY
ncbi:MAG: oligosaccharide flippase family protein, partial [Pseudomonadota bacterium]